MKNHVDFDTDTSDYQYQYFLERKEPLLTAVSQRLWHEVFSSWLEDNHQVELGLYMYYYDYY